MAHQRRDLFAASSTLTQAYWNIASKQRPTPPQPKNTGYLPLPSITLPISSLSIIILPTTVKTSSLYHHQLQKSINDTRRPSRRSHSPASSTNNLHPLHDQSPRGRRRPRHDDRNGESLLESQKALLARRIFRARLPQEGLHRLIGLESKGQRAKIELLVYFRQS